MLREHAPLIAVSAVVAILFYLVFRDLRGLHAELDALNSSSAMALVEDARPTPPEPTATPTPEQPGETGTPGTTAPTATKRRA